MLSTYKFVRKPQWVSRARTCPVCGLALESVYAKLQETMGLETKEFCQDTVFDTGTWHLSDVNRQWQDVLR